MTSQIEVKAKDNGRLRDILATIICELVDEPDTCSVKQTTSDGAGTIILTVRTANEEIGKVIGRQGKNAQALRTILEAMAAKYKLRVVLEIADARKTKRSRNHD